MPRTKGALNKLKSVEYYEKLVEQAKEKMNKKVPENEAPENETPEIIEKTGKVRNKIDVTITKPKIREIKENESYKCGGCKNILDKPYPICPFCYVNLSWS